MNNNKVRTQGRNVGVFVVGMAERELPDIQNLVQRDKAATRIELPIFMAWATAHALDGSGTDIEVIRLMGAVVVSYVVDISDWDEATALKIYGARFDEYSAAQEDGETGPANLFTACCERVREQVRYDEIIPNPDDLRLVADSLDDPGAIENIEKLRREGHPTYSLTLANMKVTISVCSVATAAKEIR